jgi:hypothetical protein
MAVQLIVQHCGTAAGVTRLGLVALYARRYTPSHCGACADGRDGSTVVGEQPHHWSTIVRLGMAVRSACFAAAKTLGQLMRPRTVRAVRVLSERSPSLVTLGQLVW